MSICSRVLAVTNQGLIMEYNIYDVLEKVRTRTGMYIGEQKLENLMSFLAGYRFAMESIGAVNISQPDFHGFTIGLLRNTVFMNPHLGGLG